VRFLEEPTRVHGASNDGLGGGQRELLRLDDLAT